MQSLPLKPCWVLLLWAPIGLGVFLAKAAPAAAPEAADSIEVGDAAYARRAMHRDDEGHPDPAEVRRAAAAYRNTIAADPGNLDARWKLMRALHFEAEFTRVSEEKKREGLNFGVEASARALAVLGMHADGEGMAMAGDPAALRRLYAKGLRKNAAQIHFYSALLWGTWSQESGVLRAIRKGVVRRLRDHSRIVVALDPGLEGGGGYRFLANLHARLPRVPFFTSWVDRSQAIPNARRALALAPEHPGNRLLYASLRLDLGGGSTAEALAELRGVASIEPRPEELAEDLAVRRSARERLAKAETAGVRAGPQPRPWSSAFASRRSAYLVIQ